MPPHTTSDGAPEAKPLQVSGLTFSYRARPDLAIEDISFELDRGELLLIAGASGCGKTTLARCVNGLIPRSYKGELSGQVHIYGEPAGKLSLSQLSQRVGTLLQDPERQIVGSNVKAEVAFGPENLGLARDEIETRIDEALGRLGILHLKGRETFELSGGEKQKVALAGVLAMRPSILILDEPLSSLDPASAHEAMEIFRGLADEGSSVILIEHRVEDALGYGPDRLMYMDEGRIHYLGNADVLPSEIDHRQVKLPAAWVIARMHELDQSAPEPIRDRTSSGESLVRFDSVWFAYDEDEPQVLKDISWEIRRGDMIAVLGPNGAGKSTLVKHAIGLLKPGSGTVTVEGTDTRQLSIAEIAHTVGYVFQSPSHMLFAPTVREELEFGPENIGLDEAERAESIRESVQAVNLAELIDYSPLGLSFGQQKRTTIAAVLAMRSRILIMDEPTAGQDYANYRRFMDSLCTPASPGEQSLLSRHFDATLFITHDLDLAVTYANRVVLINDGRIAADGKPERILTDFDLLRDCRIRPTSLLELNVRKLADTGEFMSAEALSAYVNGA